MKKVRCIIYSLGLVNEGVEKGKVYYVRSEYKTDSDLIYILTKNGYSYYSHNFVVVGCPCDIKNCVTKHVEKPE